MEILAILSSLTYTILYLLESAWCWPFAIIGSLLYFFLCRKANLQGESWLQLFYVGFAIVGWWNKNPYFEHLEWKNIQHLIFLLSTVMLWKLLFVVLKKRETALPLADSFVLAFALMGTVLQILYVEMNWIYLLLVNGVSIYTYWQRGMKKSVILYFIYFGLSIYGIIR